MFDDMMLMPFGSMRGNAGRGGGIFGMMDELMAGMDGRSMMARGGAGDPSGQGGFSCQSMCMSMSMGPDGQMHTERFSSSTIGDNERRVRETQQAYSNSRSGVDKMSLERQMDDRGRKMVKERSRLTGEERSTNMFRGMQEEHAAEFDSQWQQRAAPYLPPHYNGPMQLSVGNDPMYGRQQQQRLTAGPSYAQQQQQQQQFALPSSSSQYYRRY